MNFTKKLFENIVGKRENAGDQHFLLFPRMFSILHIAKFSFDLHLFCHLQVLCEYWSKKYTFNLQYHTDIASKQLSLVYLIGRLPYNAKFRRPPRKRAFENILRRRLNVSTFSRMFFLSVRSKLK